MKNIKYIETDWEFIHVGSDGDMYTTYYPGFTKKKAKMRKGLKIITINVRRNKKYISVAKEVAKAFIPNPNDYRYVKERDGNQMNTSPDNLFWSKSNRMDYDAFAEKKRGMHYKSYIGEVVGDYTVMSENLNMCTLSCNSCGNSKKVKRTRTLKVDHVCYNCKDRSLDISSIESNGVFSGWSILRENGTESKSNPNKELVLKCKCCNQEDIVSYYRFINKGLKLEHRCDILKVKVEKLSNKLSNMRARCYNPKNKSYHRYGGRGIVICDEWRTGNYDNFIKWALINGFEIGLDIDREDNDGNYTPSNCRFVSQTVNTRNNSITVLNRELVDKIRSTNWGKDDNRQIADKLGFSKDRVRVGNAIGNIRRGKTWVD